MLGACLATLCQGCVGWVFVVLCLRGCPVMMADRMSILWCFRGDLGCVRVCWRVLVFVGVCWE